MEEKYEGAKIKAAANKARLFGIKRKPEKSCIVFLRRKLCICITVYTNNMLDPILHSTLSLYIS